LIGGLEHLKIETRLIDQRFATVIPTEGWLHLFWRRIKQGRPRVKYVTLKLWGVRKTDKTLKSKPLMCHLGTEALARAPTTIALRHEEDTDLRKCPWPQCCRASCILGTKTKVGSTTVKTPVPRTHPNIDEAPTTPKSHTHLSHECVEMVFDSFVYQVLYIHSRMKFSVPRSEISFIPRTKGK
jgi:hypothetical protein